MCTTQHLTDISSQVVKAARGRNLFFSAEPEKHIAASDCIFVSVNTPTKTKGVGAGKAADLSFWEGAARMIASVSKSSKVVVEKSTVPVKTAEAIGKVRVRRDMRDVIRWNARTSSTGQYSSAQSCRDEPRAQSTLLQVFDCREFETCKISFALPYRPNHNSVLCLRVLLIAFLHRALDPTVTQRTRPAHYRHDHIDIAPLCFLVMIGLLSAVIHNF
jgi:hypothetical protein